MMCENLTDDGAEADENDQYDLHVLQRRRSIWHYGMHFNDKNGFALAYLLHCLGAIEESIADGLIAGNGNGDGFPMFYVNGFCFY